ncbi:MAG: YggT family protein [Deltaproteobacteria bacterium]|nr:YggT family protein [Deltaproteobacteria bacterium]MBW1952319.1 YggT family protein [Deltaproteobacteria bacterium]MBW1986510.1 YggT family protein [Deltaproteobacteria bacterium]MBW2135089.1 YggT family protein [Deltaproteobacteria bacterium]
MFILANLLNALAYVLSLVLTVYMWLIIARAILSWVNPDPYNPIVRFLYNITEPALSFFRRRLPLVYGGLDLSPLVVLLVIVFANYFVVQTLRDLARWLISPGY